MKVYVSTDMEGISGVVTWKQTGRDGKDKEYERARHLLTADVNAAVEGALSAGAEEIVVMDGHGGGNNFVVEELHPAGRYITGAVCTPQLLPGLDKSVDAVVLIGFHAMAGTERAILDHTQSSKTWYNYYLNGIKMGEIGQEAVIAGHYGIPVVFVSGDKAACEEARGLLGNIEVAVVKEGLTRTCAEILPPVKAREIIAAGVTRALKRLPEFKPYLIKTPVEIRLETQNTDVADGYERAGWERLDGRTVTRIARSALEIL